MVSVNALVNESILLSLVSAYLVTAAVPAFLVLCRNVGVLHSGWNNDYRRSATHDNYFEKE